MSERKRSAIHLKGDGEPASTAARDVDRTFNGVKVFSATMYHDREQLGEKVTAWLAQYPSYAVAEMLVTQSSDNAFHCIAITVFYRDPAHVARTFPPARRLTFRGGE